ncbi:hypothetical protein EVAR_33091_1 [Eumeta japonica]|uniref:Uncharacterized protein n=1 Tax=Eumeta variegata TaxID=151549 RepID=A0A4C1YBL0_EUMVA|nr:hypothetical protein EVAR_33091_1 [Eumeta japonica]
MVRVRFDARRHGVYFLNLEKYIIGKGATATHEIDARLRKSHGNSDRRPRHDDDARIRRAPTSSLSTPTTRRRPTKTTTPLSRRRPINNSPRKQ